MLKKFLHKSVWMGNILLLAGCGSAMQNATEPTIASAVPQKQGTDLGAARPTAAKQVPMGHAAMQGMDHSKMGNMEGMDHSKMGNMQGMDHSTMNRESSNRGGHAHQSTMEHGGHDKHGSGASGQPGKASQVSRTVNVKASDTMRFDPATLQVKAGETIRFVVNNVGKVPHEFVIGTPAEQKEHEQMMQKMPGMKHEDANAVTLEPGETKTLIWQFGNAQAIELGCHIPGHYPAGMVSKVSVTGTK